MSSMLVKIGYDTVEESFYELWEVPNNLSVKEIEMIIFEAVKYAYENSRYLKGNFKLFLEYAIESNAFEEYLTKKGFRKVIPDEVFIFWGWNSIDRFWEYRSSGLDERLWEYLEKEVNE